MLKKIVKQQKKDLLTLMLKNEIAEMWLTKKIAETPEEIKKLDIDKLEGQIKIRKDTNSSKFNIEKLQDQKEQYNKYISYLEKLDNILKAKEDNLFDLEYIDVAAEKVKRKG